MPLGNDPPQPKFRESVLNALSGMSYNSTNLAFTSAGSDYYLFPEVDPNGSYTDSRWFHGKASEGGTCPRGLITETVFDIITGGTWNGDVDGVDYNGATYRFSLTYNSTTGHTDVVEVEV